MSKKTKKKLKMLLSKHATYVKFYVDALLMNNFDTIIIFDVLLSIQNQLGLFLKDFIGSDNSVKVTDLFKQRIVLISKLIEQNFNNDIVEKMVKNDKLIEKIIHIPCDELNRQNQYVIAMIRAHQQNDIMGKYIIYDTFSEYMMSFSDMLYEKIIMIHSKNKSTIGSMFAKFPTYVFSAWGIIDYK